MFFHLLCPDIILTSYTADYLNEQFSLGGPLAPFPNATVHASKKTRLRTGVRNSPLVKSLFISDNLISFLIIEIILYTQFNAHLVIKTHFTDMDHIEGFIRLADDKPITGGSLAEKHTIAPDGSFVGKSRLGTINLQADRTGR